VLYSVTSSNRLKTNTAVPVLFNQIFHDCDLVYYLKVKHKRSNAEEACKFHMGNKVV
jgi:hypothetical protein